MSQVFSAQASLKQVQDDSQMPAKSDPASDAHSQYCSPQDSPTRGRASDKSRPHSPDYERMFRFQGHFEPPNNPDMPEPDQVSTELPHQQATAALSQDVQPALIPTSTVTGSNSRQRQGLNHADPHKHAARQKEMPQRPESEFRHSHSPEFYDAKFKRYVLRSGCIRSEPRLKRQRTTAHVTKGCSYWDITGSNCMVAVHWWDPDARVVHCVILFCRTSTKHADALRLLLCFC